MANFDKSGMTQAGINLMGKAIGGATIQFTKLVLGDGTMTGEILDLQGVVSPKQNVDVTRIERNDNQCTVGGELLTSTVKQGFFWRECGLYAMDPDQGEVLYNYAYSTKPDYIAASDSGMMEEILVSMIATVGSNANVDVTIDTSMVMTTKKEFMPLKQKVDDISISVKEFGATGDGVTDDTQAINDALSHEYNSCTIFFPKGTYVVDGSFDGDINTEWFYSGLCVKSNTRIILDKEAIIKQKTTNRKAYSIFNIHDAENVTIEGGVIIGDKDTHIYDEQSSHEWGHAIYIRSCKNVTIKDSTIKKTTGDGIYVGNSYHLGTDRTKNSKNIYLDNVLIDEVSRNGISICSVEGIIVSNSTIKNVTRTLPKSAVDIESEGYWYHNIDNVLIQGLTIENCTHAIFSTKGKNVQIKSVFAKDTGAMYVDGQEGTIAELSDIKGVSVVCRSSDVKIYNSDIALFTQLHEHLNLQSKNINLYNCTIRNAYIQNPNSILIFNNCDIIGTIFTYEQVAHDSKIVFNGCNLNAENALNCGPSPKCDIVLNGCNIVSRGNAFIFSDNKNSGNVSILNCSIEVLSGTLIKGNKYAYIAISGCTINATNLNRVIDCTAVTFTILGNMFTGTEPTEYIINIPQSPVYNNNITVAGNSAFVQIDKFLNTTRSMSLNCVNYLV